MGILNKVSSPQDLKNLSDDKVEELAAEIRQFLIDKVSITGGHLGPNLGVVELTIALHRVFDSPRDPIVFDTSHQSDRKSTRLNSSHVAISYAVFCLQK